MCLDRVTSTIPIDAQNPNVKLLEMQKPREPSAKGRSGPRDSETAERRNATVNSREHPHCDPLRVGSNMYARDLNDIVLQRVLGEGRMYAHDQDAVPERASGDANARPRS